MNKSQAIGDHDRLHTRHGLPGYLPVHARSPKIPIASRTAVRTKRLSNPRRAIIPSTRSLAIDHIRLWSPTGEQVATTWREPIAGCLSAAFSSGPWKQTPMPLGDSTDRHSARGILAEFGQSSQALMATSASECDVSRSVLGCVIGSQLNQELIDHYGLEPYGAQPGDALFAYIGVRPSLQGRRLQPSCANRYNLDWRANRGETKKPGSSLASLLFSNWLNLPAIGRCPRVFIRTREVLTPIQALAERNGFEYCGKFYLDFQGHRQDRMVYRRSMT